MIPDQTCVEPVKDAAPLAWRHASASEPPIEPRSAARRTLYRTGVRVLPGEPIVWRLSLASAREAVFDLLDTDEGRERFWAQRSQAGDDGFDLEFARGLHERVRVLEREPPTRMRILYFGAEAEFTLAPRDDGGCTFEVTCQCADLDEWMEFYPGWVSWLLVLKGVADFGVDLRSGSADRTWGEWYVDP
jgi:hypothetical protein